jgi:nickel-dependent lactate racemase
MHAAACEAAQRFAMRAVPEPFDVVVTSNSGYPLDQNLYQAVKGMSAAAKVVKPGGLIVCAAECRDGFPGHGSYRELLGGDPREFLRTIMQSDHATPDQWQVQIQYNVQDHARVVVHTSHLSDEELKAVHLEQTGDISRTVAAEGAHATVCVLPEGPQTIAYVA